MQQPTLVSDSRALLSESLSSLFFKNLKILNEDQNVKKEIKSKKNAAAETHDKKTSHLPLPPSRGPLKDSNTPVKINDVTPPSSKEKSQKTLDPVDSEIREIKRDRKSTRLNSSHRR